jgi:hypothetical protein
MTDTDYEDADLKSRESQLRSKARSQGLALRKARVRNPRDLDFGTYHLVDPNRNSIVAKGVSDYGLSLDEVAEYLKPEEK